MGVTSHRLGIKLLMFGCLIAIDPITSWSLCLSRVNLNVTEGFWSSMHGKDKKIKKDGERGDKGRKVRRRSV